MEQVQKVSRLDYYRLEMLRFRIPVVGCLLLLHDRSNDRLSQERGYPFDREYRGVEKVARHLWKVLPPMIRHGAEELHLRLIADLGFDASVASVASVGYGGFAVYAEKSQPYC